MPAHLHLRLQVGGLVADDIGRQRDLVVVFHVHEMEAVAVLVEVLVLAVLDIGALDLFGGLVALRDLYAVADPAHVDLGGGRALAGMEVFGLENDVELAVELDDIAFAERAGDDFHGDFLDCRAAAADAGAAQMSGRTILILRPFASIFAASAAPERPVKERHPMPSPLWARHADRRPFLLGRMRIVAALRQVLRGAGFRRGRDRGAGARRATRPICMPSPPTRVAGGHARAALSAHLAGIRLQEAAGGRRAPDRRVRPLVPQPRARRAAPSGIHPGRMVSGGRAV